MTQRRILARERRRNIFVGLTTLAGLAGLVLLLTAFGYVPALLRSGYTVTVYLDNVAGLHVNSPVTLWGNDVGEVEAKGFAEPGAPERAYLKLRIDGKVQVPKDIEVQIEKQVFGGGPVVALVGSTPGATPLATDGTAVITRVSIVDPVARLEQAGEDISKLSRSIDQLLSSDQPGEPSLSRVVVKLEGRLDELERVIASAGQWLGDEQLRGDVTQAAANARKLTESLGTTVANLEQRYAALADSVESRLGKVDGTLDTARQAFNKTAASFAAIEARYVALADDASKVVTQIDSMVAKANNKDSTIGLLLSDPQLYNNLTDTSERLKLMIDEARLLIEKWQAEGVPIRVFN